MKKFLLGYFIGALLGGLTTEYVLTNELYKEYIKRKNKQRGWGL